MISSASADVLMPRLTDSMEEGTIVRWLKSPGDEVAVGDPLVEVETDKATMVYEADAAGTLLETLAGEGDTIAVGAPIARLGPDAPSPSRRPAVKASPLARRLATDRGVDLESLDGTGPGGRIVKADVEAAASRPAAPEARDAGAKGAVEIVEPTRLQRTVARRMAESRATIPHFPLSAEIDMSRCVEARARWRAAVADGEVVPSLNDMVVKACALALRAYPRANGSWTDSGFELYSRVNVGIAVASEDALVVPTLFDADRKGLLEIASETRRLVERARSGAITPPELAGGTFTVSNLGMYGVDDFEAVINPPQAAILAVGAIAERPVGRKGELALAPVMRVTLACDHRIIYGADGARLLQLVRGLLEEPVRLAG